MALQKARTYFDALKDLTQMPRRSVKSEWTEDRQLRKQVLGVRCGAAYDS